MTVVTLGLHLIVRKLRTRKEHNQEANPFYALLKRYCQRILMDQPMTLYHSKISDEVG